MKWPWQSEKRESYTDVLIAAILAGAKGEVVTGLTAGTEIAAGYWQRGFASGTVEPAGIVGDALAPWLGFIGRQLVTAGEVVFEIDLERGLGLLPAHTVSVAGGPHSESLGLRTDHGGPQRRRHPDVARGPGVTPNLRSPTVAPLARYLADRIGRDHQATTGQP